MTLNPGILVFAVTSEFQKRNRIKIKSWESNSGLVPEIESSQDIMLINLAIYACLDGFFSLINEILIWKLHFVFIKTDDLRLLILHKKPVLSHSSCI